MLGGYYLPRAITQTGQTIEWEETAVQCMAGCRVLLSGPRPFLDLWQPILVEAQCVIVFRLPPHDVARRPGRNAHPLKGVYEASKKNL